jgi:hypothetical protein
MLRFAVTVVLSAFLLFLVQPLVGKVVLPWFGGAPAVWTTCLLFFQLVLLGGYAWSHLVVRRLRGPWQRRAHLLLLGTAVLAVVATAAWWGTPLVPTATLRPDAEADPVSALLLLLGLSVGLPYFALSSTGPLLQAWVAQRVPTATAMRLYAASNVGSLGGLLAFPVLLEPFWPLRTLAWGWAAGFIVFALACGSVAWRAPEVPPEAATAEALPGKTVALWVLFAALPSGLLLAMTNHLTQDVAPIPFLWVLPLVVYLASFVVTFDNERWYGRAWALPLLVLFGVLTAGLLLYPIEPSALVALSVYLGFLALGCVVAHGELVKLRPGSGHLTAFYLAVAAGGALGGFLVAVVARFVFREYTELPLLCGALVLAAAAVVAREGTATGKRFLAGATLVAVLFGWSVFLRGQGALETRRDFFGVVRVEKDARRVKLVHGRVLHGAQWLAEDKRRVGTTYYHPTSGAGLLLTARERPWRVGLVGLGVGTLAAYARPGDAFRFYEISPIVVAYAQGEGGYFSFLSGAPERPEVVLGDARTSLEREAPNRFDALLLDAFSGDSVPTHLLTKEAFELYLSHLAGDSSVIAVHISNRYIRLLPVVARLAHELGLHGVGVEVEAPEEPGTRPWWVLLSKDPKAIEVQAKPDELLKLEGFRRAPLWTDDFTSLWGLVDW